MRTLVSLGLLALSFGCFANTALAGIEDCEPLKQNGNKSLYGLCVAWHSADEEAKLILGEKFYERAGFEVPGSEVTDPDPEPADFACPCWEEFSFAGICALGAPTYVDLQPDFGYADVTFDGSVAFSMETFGADTWLKGCAHVIQDVESLEFLEGSIVIGGLGDEDAEACLAEAMEMATIYESVGGDCSSL